MTKPTNWHVRPAKTQLGSPFEESFGPRWAHSHFVDFVMRWLIYNEHRVP